MNAHFREHQLAHKISAKTDNNFSNRSRSAAYNSILKTCYVSFVSTRLVYVRKSIGKEPKMRYT